MKAVCPDCWVGCGAWSKAAGGEAGRITHASGPSLNEELQSTAQLTN
jgi:hypothetical protein